MMSPTIRFSLGVFFVVLLALSPIGLVWFGAEMAEPAVSAGKSDRADRWLSVIAPLSSYPLLPLRAEARVEGVRCQVAMTEGREEEALDHFLREIKILSGRDLTSGEPAPEGFAFIKHRKGFDVWSAGYREWAESAPAAPPDFDRDFLPPERTSPPETGGRAESTPASELSQAFADLLSDRSGLLRDAYFAAVRGQVNEGRDDFLARNSELLKLARAMADQKDPRAVDPEWCVLASDAFRILVLQFVHAVDRKDAAAALGDFKRCGRILRLIESRPSLVSFLTVIALRSGWHGALEALAEDKTLAPSIRQGLLDHLPLFTFDPHFPVRCLRHEYADQRELMADAYLGGPWEEAGPAGRRLFTRQMELLLLETYRPLAMALSPETPAEEAEAIETSLMKGGSHRALALAQRAVFAEVFYGVEELTEEGGRRYARAIDEFVTANALGIPWPRLGRMRDTLRELAEEEARQIETLRARMRPE